MRSLSLTTKKILLLNISLIAAVFGFAQTGQARIKIDTVFAKPTKEVEISMDVPADKNSIIHLVNSSRNIEIKTWPESKVKIVSTLSVEEGAKVGAGVDMLERSGVTMRSTSSRVEISSRTSSHTTAYGGKLIQDGLVYRTDAATTLAQGQSNRNVTTVISGYQPKKRTLSILVPEGSKLDIDNKSSDIILRNNFKEAKFDLSSTNLDCQNINDLELFAKYSIVNVGDVDDAEVEFENGTLRATNIKNLDIDSKSSTIEYENGNNIYMRSQRDNITIETIKKVEGRKLYGELRIDKLYTTLDIEGTNADIRIRNIMPEVDKIKLNDKYADIRLPIKNLQNYSVVFEGNHSTVFAPFAKNEIKEDKKADVSVEPKKTASNTSAPPNVAGGTMVLSTPARTSSGTTFHATTTHASAPTRFTASVGDAKSKRTKFELICHSCTIDFK